MIDMLGIAASLVLVASFAVTGEEKIRIINLFGGILFVIYGILIGAVGTWLSNGVISLIHLWYLLKKR